MQTSLKKGEHLQTESGKPLLVERFLGSGGQGEVWDARLDGRHYALKWYHQNWVNGDASLRARLQALVASDAPADNFVWPLELVDAAAKPSFGYLMPLLDTKRFASLRGLDTRRITPTLRTLTTIGLNVSEAFLHLHAQGLCYRDISKDNILFDPGSGEIRVVDNDNVAVSGSDAAIGGTPEFMAPELVRGDPGAKTSRYTDLHSLAVLLFCLTHLHHPLEGKRKLSIKCWDRDAKHEMYGRKPLFIFDPYNDSNRAVAKSRSEDPTGEAGDNALAFWPIYPRILKELFTRAFTSGLKERSARISAAEWRGALVTVRDGIVYCGSCGEQNFTEADGTVVGGRCFSPKCGKQVQTPFRLVISNNSLMLNADTRLYPHHVAPSKSFDFQTPIGSLKQHPAQPDVWGLTNESNIPWTGSLPTGEVVDVPPGRSIRLAEGTRISFGSATGVIKR